MLKGIIGDYGNKLFSIFMDAVKEVKENIWLESEKPSAILIFNSELTIEEFDILLKKTYIPNLDELSESEISDMFPSTHIFDNPTIELRMVNHTDGITAQTIKNQIYDFFRVNQIDISCVAIHNISIFEKEFNLQEKITELENISAMFDLPIIFTCTDKLANKCPVFNSLVDITTFVNE